MRMREEPVETRCRRKENKVEAITDRNLADSLYVSIDARPADIQEGPTLNQQVVHGRNDERQRPRICRVRVVLGRWSAWYQAGTLETTDSIDRFAWVLVQADELL
jgi:hypothetical protein